MLRNQLLPPIATPLPYQRVVVFEEEAAGLVDCTFVFCYLIY
jgi:hypothetical protein